MKALGRFDEAAASLQCAVELKPDYAQAHCNLGAVHQQQGETEQAMACFRQALRLRPDHTEAANRLGDLLMLLGRLDEAEACFRQVLSHCSNGSEALNNLGNVLGLAGKWPQAMDCYQRALSLEPDCAAAHYNLGRACAAHGNRDQAAACYRRALNLKPDLAEAHEALGTMLGELEGRADEAVACLQQALRLQPTDRLRIALATCLPAIYPSTAEVARWRSRLVEEVSRLRQRGVVLDLTTKPALSTFLLAYQGFNDRDILREVGRLYRVPEEVGAGRPAPIRGSRKIRVGFVSSFFKEHIISHWMRGLIAHLARAEFEVTVLSVGCTGDAMTEVIKQHADRFVDIPPHLPVARRLIAEQQLDVLVYTDIGMDPLTYTLALSRLAPIQCTTLGHPVTTGLDSIDYYISTEDLETEEAQEHYTEKLVRLKALPIYYYKPAPAAVLKAREAFGLAKEDHVYACLQSPFKLHPDFDAILGGVLRGDPRGKLLLTQSVNPHWERLLRQRFAATLPDVLDRIRFFPMLSREEYMNLLAHADVLLDPHPFGGGTTSYDGFALGTPVVTMPSRLLRGASLPPCTSKCTCWTAWLKIPKITSSWPCGWEATPLFDNRSAGRFSPPTARCSRTAREFASWSGFSTR